MKQAITRSAAITFILFLIMLNYLFFIYCCVGLEGSGQGGAEKGPGAPQSSETGGHREERVRNPAKYIKLIFHIHYILLITYSSLIM